jgi:hypothetical protein
VIKLPERISEPTQTNCAAGEFSSAGLASIRNACSLDQVGKEIPNEKQY